MRACALQVEMAQLGAEGVLDTPHIPELPAGQPEQAPGAGEAVGGRVTVHFAGVGVWCRGEVLAYDPAREVSSDKLQAIHTPLAEQPECLHAPDAVLIPLYRVVGLSVRGRSSHPERHG